MIIHPASTTHQQLSPQQQVESGITDDFVRFSIGIEDIEDILADLDQALTKVKNNIIFYTIDPHKRPNKMIAIGSLGNKHQYYAYLASTL